MGTEGRCAREPIVWEARMWFNGVNSLVLRNNIMNQQHSLLEQLQSDFDLSDDDIAALVAAAKEQALVEARITLKNLMLQNILSRALAQPEALLKPEAFEVETADFPHPFSSLPEDEARLRREIVTLRQQLIESEQLLSDADDDPFTPMVSGTPFLESDAYTLLDDDNSYGYYIYGIIYEPGQQPVRDLAIEGIGSRLPVYAIPYQSIQAILSKVSLEEFGETALEINLQDRDWLDMNVRAHQDIIERVMGCYSLIPMRFCTICRSEQEVMELLMRYHDDFAENLARMKGKQEWDVKMYGLDETLRELVPQVSPKIKELNASLNGKSDGAAYFVRKKIAHLVREEAEQIGRNYAMQSHSRLLNHAEAAADLPLSSPNPPDDQQKMLFNGAYLVPEDRIGDFQAELERLTHEYEDKGLKFELTGPCPPYNFVKLTVDVNQDEAGVADIV